MFRAAYMSRCLQAVDEWLACQAGDRASAMVNDPATRMNVPARANGGSPVRMAVAARAGGGSPAKSGLDGLDLKKAGVLHPMSSTSSISSAISGQGARHVQDPVSLSVSTSVTSTSGQGVHDPVSSALRAVREEIARTGSPRQAVVCTHPLQDAGTTTALVDSKLPVLKPTEDMLKPTEDSRVSASESSGSRDGCSLSRSTKSAQLPTFVDPCTVVDPQGELVCEHVQSHFCTFIFTCTHTLTLSHP